MNATETYQSRRREIDERIVQLQDRLREMDAAQAREPRNWGFAGSAGHIESQLEEILTTLTGEEA